MAEGERESFLTPSEAAELLGVHPRTLSRWEQAGQLHVIRTVGGHRRYRRSEVMAVRASAREVPTGATIDAPAVGAVPSPSRKASGKDRARARRRALELLHAADVSEAEPAALLEATDEDFTRALVTGVTAQRAEIDALISARVERWSIDRMPVVDRNLLRLGVFELLYTDTPHGVVIDQAVTLAKMLSTEESGRFVNGVLGRIAREQA